MAGLPAAAAVPSCGSGVKVAEGASKVVEPVKGELSTGSTGGSSTNICSVSVAASSSTKFMSNTNDCSVSAAGDSSTGLSVTNS